MKLIAELPGLPDNDNAFATRDGARPAGGSGPASAPSLVFVGDDDASGWATHEPVALTVLRPANDAEAEAPAGAELDALLAADHEFVSRCDAAREAWMDALDADVSAEAEASGARGADEAPRAAGEGADDDECA